MRICGLILPALLVTISGCIVTYRDFPIVDPLPSLYEPSAPPRCLQSIKFSDGSANQSTWDVRLSTALQEALQHYGGCRGSSPVDDTSRWADTKVVVNVLGKPILSSYWMGFWEQSTFWSLFIIPYYRGQMGWELSYNVYDRNALKKAYQYEITGQVVAWILLLPFSWINFFTYSLEDAARSTTAQFVVDAQRDGYLGTKN